MEERYDVESFVHAKHVGNEWLHELEVFRVSLMDWRSRVELVREFRHVDS